MKVGEREMTILFLIEMRHAQAYKRQQNWGFERDLKGECLRERQTEKEREWGTWARESGVEFEPNLLRAG